MTRLWLKHFNNLGRQAFLLVFSLLPSPPQSPCSALKSDGLKRKRLFWGFSIWGWPRESFYFCWVRLPDDHYYRALCSLEVVLKASHPLLDKNIHYLLFPYSICQLFHGTSCRGFFFFFYVSVSQVVPICLIKQVILPDSYLSLHPPSPNSCTHPSVNSGHLHEPGIILGAVLVGPSCPTLCNPMDCSPPGSSIHGIFQARILE